jgi:hypothetical protein
MTAKTFTSAGVNNLWSNAANWGGTAPVDNDSVTIPTGQTCEFDVDMSNAGTWPNGIDGLTITSTGVLKLSRTTSGYLKIKAAKTITGTGTFDCGASAGDAIPFAVKHTVTGGAGWYINGASGLTMTVYAAEPAIKTILLTALEPIGETAIAVATSVVGDIWADGDIIHIDDINQARETEERTIAAGGIAAGVITITAGLTAAKSPGAVLSLMTRNVKFIGVSNTAALTQGFAAGKLTIAGGQWTTANYWMFTGNPVISGGTFYAGTSIVFLATTVSISGGVFSGSGTVSYNVNGVTITGGSFTGNGTVFSGGTLSPYAVIISAGTFSGNTSVASSIIGVTIFGGTFSGNTDVLLSCTGVSIFGGAFTSNVDGLHGCIATIKNASFSSNTYDINNSIINCFNVLLGSTENNGYATFIREIYSESIDHDQNAGAFKSWTKGGVTSSQTATPPTGYTQYNQTVLENAAVEGFWQKEVLVAAGASITITMNLRKTASMTYLPRCIVFNKAATDPFAGGAGLTTFTMTNSIDTWEASSYTYTNTGSADVVLVIRFQGMNASGNMLSAVTVNVINVDLTTALAQLALIKATVEDNQALIIAT